MQGMSGGMANSSPATPEHPGGGAASRRGSVSPERKGPGWMVRRVRWSAAVICLVAVALLSGLVFNFNLHQAKAAPNHWKLGVFRGALHPTNVDQHEQWLGRDVDVV